MNTEWKKVKLKEVSDFTTGKLNSNAAVAGGEYPFFTCSPETLQIDTYAFDQEALLLAGNNAEGNFSLKYYYGRFNAYQRTYVISSKDKNILDLKFLYYSLRLCLKFFKDLSQGTATKFLTASILNNFEIVLPPVDIQKSVTRILSAFDDKIELNTQINHNLEEQAKAIFKSWFVDFEPFAGKEPDGLKVVNLQSICELVTKGTTPTTLGFAFTQDGINFIKAESISDTHCFDIDKFSYIDQQTNNALKRSIIQDGDILFTIAGTLGRFAIADKSILPANTNQAVAIIRPKLTEVHPYYIYSFLLGGWHTEHYRKRVQQAVQANLSLTTIKSLPILLLPETLKQQYENIITPLFKKILQNTLENRTLCKLRDSLLPKLISGEIDVSEVEI